MALFLCLPARAPAAAASATPIPDPPPALTAAFPAAAPPQEWHQKLHNNTTPDDVPICEAYIAFLQSNGNKQSYWRVLSDAGAPPPCLPPCGPACCPASTRPPCASPAIRLPCDLG